MTVKVLVSAGSKHGATAEIADFIGETLARRDLNVTVAKPEEVTNLIGYQAVVLGSAFYAGHWSRFGHMSASGRPRLSRRAPNSSSTS